MTMIDRGTTAYPVLEELEDIVQETKGWYRALGIRLGGSLYSVVKATNGVSALIHMVADTIGLSTPLSKNVTCTIEDTPSIAYITYGGGGTVAHIGSWLYNRKMMEEWLPPVKHMSDSDMLALSVGMINGALALDLIAKATETSRQRTMSYIVDAIRNTYKRINVNEPDIVFVFNNKTDYKPVNFYEGMIDDKIKYISSAIHDILGMKAAIRSKKRTAGWVIFPVLMFRTFFDGEFAINAKINIEREDSIENFMHAITALRCFSTTSAEILDIKTSLGINVVRALLESIGDEYRDAKGRDDPDTSAQYMAEDIFAFYQEAVDQPQDKKEDDNQKEKDQNSEDGDGLGDVPNSHVKNIDVCDSSAPINEDLKEMPEGVKTREEGHEERHEPISENKLTRANPKGSKRDETEKFMRELYNPDEVKYQRTPSATCRTIYLDSIDAYCALEHTTRHSEGDAITKIASEVDRTSLRNLFLAKTMDVEKSQPARSGISLIPTRIVNMFTDEKMFSPLPEELTERDSEVILLVDASGSMRGGGFYFTDSSGYKRDATLVNGVMGVASALLDGLAMSNIKCGVYAHTTIDTKEGEAVVVVKIADETTRNSLEQFASTAAISNQNNGDSFAIEEAIKHFADDGKERGRTLIVLSDGQPACDAYCNRVDGNKETKKVVDRVREDGTAVYSISLVERVVENNNEIYGEKFNIFPANADSRFVEINSILRNIVKVVAKDALRSANNVLTQG